MAYPVIISYNSANLKEHTFVKKLVDYLGTKGIEVVADDPNRSEPTMKQWLLNAQWLVLILSPEAIRSPWVQSLVNTAFDRVRQGHMQGVLALAFSSNPVEPEDMPNPSWSTIRTYYTGESDEDHQRAFEKLTRTLGYTKVPVHSASSSANNWASSFGYNGPTASRRLPVTPQSTQGLRSRLVISVIAVVTLIAILFAGYFVASSIAKHQTTPTPNVTLVADKTATAHANASATAHANASATALSQQATPTPQEIYGNATNKKPTFSMDANDKNQDWDGNGTCMFTNGAYQISTTDPNQYTRCMAKGTNLKNFAYQVQMTIFNDGDAGGLIFRADEGLKNFYRFSLDSQEMYRLYACHPCNGTDPQGGDKLREKPSSGIAEPTGVANILTVIVLNTTIYLYINETPVETLDNSAIPSSGEIGLYAYSANQSAKVTFNEVKVWKLPDNGKFP